MQQNLLLDHSFDETDSTEIFDIATGRDWLKISSSITDDDTKIGKLITTARQQCEEFLNISLVEKVVTACIQNDLGDMRLPYGPVGTINYVKDRNGNAITNYTTRYSQFKILEGTLTTPFQLCCIDWPANNLAKEFEVNYDAGYEICPEMFVTAVKEQLAYLYERRGDEELPQILSPLVKISLQPYRRVT